MKKLAIIFSVILLNWSCNKGDRDGRTLTLSYWVNKSSHKVQIHPYDMGSIRGPYDVTLNPGERIQIATYVEMGKNSVGAGFYSDYLQPSDSIIVTFDGLYNITHYLGPMLQVSSKYYPLSSNRNLGNILSYQETVEKETEISIDIKYEYHFTDQDYLDAK